MQIKTGQRREKHIDEHTSVWLNIPYEISRRLINNLQYVKNLHYPFTETSGEATLKTYTTHSQKHPERQR